MNGGEAGDLQRVHTTLNLIWLGMFGALCIYVVIGLLFSGQLDADLRQPPSVLEIVRPVFLLISVVQIVLAFTLPRALLRQQLGMSRSSAGSIEISQKLQRCQNSVVISLALAEAPGLMGLVYLILSADTKSFLLFVALSAVAMVALRPKRDTLQQFVTRGRSVL
jgi:F0F1-type ATP synthase membrane subunit c/vacuolar-type H+-ATPase subunit K